MGSFFKFAVKKIFKTRPNSPYGGETSKLFVTSAGSDTLLKFIALFFSVLEHYGCLYLRVLNFIV